MNFVAFVPPYHSNSPQMDMEYYLYNLTHNNLLPNQAYYLSGLFRKTLHEKDQALQDISRLNIEKDEALEDISRLEVEKDEALEDISRLEVEKDEALEDVSRLKIEHRLSFDEANRLLKENQDALSEISWLKKELNLKEKKTEILSKR